MTLKQRMELLKINPDSVTCAAHTLKNTNEVLTDIQSCAEEIKQDVEEVEGFFHPCGGPGWRLAMHLDMSVPGTECPEVWEMAGTYCGAPTLSCFSTEVPISESYNQVCGRVHGYSIGPTGGFVQYYDSGANTGIGPDEVFANGVIITRGTDEHVFSFVAGSPLLFGGRPSDTSQRCPCLVGEDNFFATNTALPDFLNGDYFCDTTVSDPNAFLQSSLWDGLDCGECCNQGTLPYFTKVLPTATNEDLILTLCAPHNHGVYVHLVEIYVK